MTRRWWSSTYEEECVAWRTALVLSGQPWSRELSNFVAGQDQGLTLFPRQDSRLYDPISMTRLFRYFGSPEFPKHMARL
jgi:hypothetical protein